MGKLEENTKKREKRKNLQKFVLNTVKIAGVLSVGLLAPNVIGALSKVGFLPRSRQKEYISSSASKLAKRGLLKFENGYYQLTSAGEKLLSLWELADYKIKKPKRWDKKWRVIIFDIPQKKAVVRDHVTAMFRRVGLLRLQDSVWVYPYDCEDLVALLKTDLGVGKYILYMIVEELEGDRHLREDFGLIKK